MSASTKIIITGASGFIGRHCVNAIAKNPNYQIIAIGRKPCNYYVDLQNVSYLLLDLSKNIPALQCDICIHSAGLADDRSDKNLLYKNNIFATKNLINSIKGCQKFIFISSSSIYNFDDQIIKSEENADVSSNISDYGRSKLLAEKIVIESSIPSKIILRPRAVYGKYDQVLMPRIQSLIKKHVVFNLAFLNKKSSFTHINNLTNSILTILNLKLNGTLIYNICDDNPIELKEVFSLLLTNKNILKNRLSIQVPKWLIQTIVLLFPKNKLISNQSYHYLNQHSILDNRKIKTELGIDCNYSILNYLNELNNEGQKSLHN